STLPPAGPAATPAPVARLTLPVAVPARVHQGLAGRVSLQAKPRVTGWDHVAVAPAPAWVGVVSLR
ncbi:hypothetical protein IM725_10000, partial [Ramlibacter aquaticus]